MVNWVKNSGPVSNEWYSPSETN